MTTNFRLIADMTVFSRLWRTVMDEKMRPLGLTQARWVTLWWIMQSDTALNQKELARKVGLEGTTLVRQLDALEKLGLIERIVDRDRRARLINVTERAIPIMQHIRALVEELAREVLVDIKADEISLAALLVATMRERLHRRLDGNQPVVNAAEARSCLTEERASETAGPVRLAGKPR